MKALDDVSTSVSAGEIVALVGQNGSGKSTLVKVLAGVHSADPGSDVRLRDQDNLATEFHFIHQDLGLVGTLSTVENLDLDRHLGRRALLPSRRRDERRRAGELIASFGGSFDVETPVERLSAAERTIVAIARALDRWDHPHNILVLDEPTASLHGDEVSKLFVAVRRVAARGGAVIFISHRLDEVIELADRVVVLRDGRLVADVARGHYDYGDLVQLIAGAFTEPEIGGARTGEIVLTARGLSGSTIRSLDFNIGAGEILGISGVLGSGREELAAILFGASPGRVAELDVAGQRVEKVNPRRAMAAGVAYVPGDRHRQGAVMTMSSRENMTLPYLSPLRRRFSRSIDRNEERREVDAWLKRVGVRPAEPERPLELFSGGNQQKIVLAKWLRTKPKVLLLEEPTQGVDVGAKASIYGLIAGAADAGAGVLVCSSDAKELAAICDRVLVMTEGEFSAELRGTQLSEGALVGAGSGAVATDIVNLENRMDTMLDG